MIEEMLEGMYPKQAKLADGIAATIRLMVKKDAQALYDFFQAIPKEDTLYLLDDVSDRTVIDRWCNELNYEKTLPLVAEVGGKIIADVTLHQEERGWKRHIGRVRAVIHPDHRHKGLATQLVGALVEIAKQIGLDKLDGEFMPEQEMAMKVFKKLGFVKQAQLAEHVRDLKGQNHDLIILVYDLRAQEHYPAD